MLKRRIVPAALIALTVLIPAVIAGTLPRQAPEFTINLTDGKQVQLSQFKGKVVAMIFILTYCPHCQKTIGILSKQQAEFGPKGFQVLASAMEDMARQALPDFLKRFSPPFPVGYNARGPVLEFLQHPVAARLIMPQLVFLDRQGMIRAQYTGEDRFFVDDAKESASQEQNLRAKIEELLKEGVPPGPKKHSAAREKKD